MTDTTEERMVPLAMLKRAFAMRAWAYAYMFDVLREEFGTDRALELLSESTRRMGKDMGGAYEGFGPQDLDGLRDRFLDGIPAGDVMFKPEVLETGGESLEIKFHTCPLKVAWQDMGRSDEDLELLCKAAGAIDGGLFNRAGFTFAGETWKPGETGCCHLKVLRGDAA